MKRIVFLLLILPYYVHGQQEVTISAAQVVGYGIFTAKSQSRVKGFTKDSPAADAVEGVRFINMTNQIPSIPKTGFGIEYVINSSPNGRLIPITSIIKFPEPGLVSPRGRVYLVSRENSRVQIGKPTFYGYAFDEPWEMVPGEWIFEIWHKKARLVKKRFIVLPPDETATEEP